MKPKNENADHPELLDLISQVKQQLIIHHPFIGNIAFGFKYIVSSDMNLPGTNRPTLGVNPEEKEIYIHPDFVRMGKKNQRSFHEMMFCVAHECFHPMFEHHIRRNERDFRLWNVAGDYVINHYLVDDKIGIPPRGIKICLDDEIFADGEGQTEIIYNNLLEKAREKAKEGGGQSGGTRGEQTGDDQSDDGSGGENSTGSGVDDDEEQPLDVVVDHKGSPAERELESAEWRCRVAQAAQAARAQGKLSAAAERLVEELLEPRVDWERELLEFTTKSLEDKRTWSRFNRRFVSQGLYLPGRDGDVLGEVVFAADCSGSVSDKEFGACAGQMRYVKEMFDPERLHAIYFDAEVCRHDVFERWDEFKPEPSGGGGTAFSPVFEHIEEEGIEPALCVVLTDMYCDDFGEEPPYPVLWVSTSGSDWDPPFGKVIAMDI